MILKKIRQTLPSVTVGMVDYCLYVSVGKRQRGFTIGPFFLTLDSENDVWWQSPTLDPKWMSDFHFELSSKNEEESSECPETVRIPA